MISLLNRKVYLVEITTIDSGLKEFRVYDTLSKARNAASNIKWGRSDITTTILESGKDWKVIE